MSSLLERWVSQRVGYCVRLDPKVAGRLLFDGKVFYDVLESYGVVSIEMFGGVPGRGRKSVEEAYKSLAKLCDAFRLLRIDVDEQYLRRVADSDGPYAIRILYQLYLKLEDKDFIDLLAPNKSDPFAQGTKKLIQELKKKCRLKDLRYSGLAEKEFEMIQQYEDARRRIAKHCTEDIQKKREAFFNYHNKYKPTDFTKYKEPKFLTNLQELAGEGYDEEITVDPREYIETLKSHSRQRKNLERAATKAVPAPVADVWTDILERMGDDFKNNFKSKMNQQSHFEKYCAMKWTGAHHKFKRFFETKMDQYRDSDEEDDGHAVKNEILRKGGEAIGKSQEPVWQLHRKLYERRLKNIKKANFEMCRHVVQDMMDILMKILLYRYDNKRAPVPRKVMNDWKEAFFKTQLTLSPPQITSIHSSIGEEEACIEEEGPTVVLNEIDSEIFLDREVVKLLNEFNLHCYLYQVGPWDILTIPGLREEEPNLTVNGFIIHRLLETKYPLPKGYQDPQFNFTFKAALSPIKDPNTAYIYNSIRNLLTKQNVAVIDVIEPMNFCLNTYHSETAAIEEQESVKQGDETIASLQKKSIAGGRKSMGARKSQTGSRKSMGARKSQTGSRKSMGARKSQTGSRKSMGARKSQSGARKSMSRKSMGGGNKSKSSDSKNKLESNQSSRKSPRLEELGRDKAVQCPSIDDLIPRVNHSAVGLLGKEAFAALNSGKPVSDLLAGKMLIEYLKAKKSSISGFALVSYPLTVSQAVLLEFLMTGQPMKMHYKVSPEIEKFIQDELRPQPYLDTRVLVDFEYLLTPDIQDLSLNILETLADQQTAKIIIQERLRKKDQTWKTNNAVSKSLHEVFPENCLHEEVVNDVNNIPQAEERNYGLMSEINETTNFPHWKLNSYNIRTISRNDLAQKIRTETYNLGRYRPFLSHEAYEKMKSHVLALMAWVRSERKFRQEEPIDEEEDVGGFEEEDLDVINNLKPTTEESKQVTEQVSQFENNFAIKNVDKPEYYLKPVTYTQLLALRSSEILPRPNKDQMEIHYNTGSFFTKYIKCLASSLAIKEIQEYQEKKLKYEKFLESEEPGEGFILDRIIESEPDSYYKVYGKKEIFDFDSLKYDSINKLCRMIINEIWDEENAKRRNSQDLFDNEALKKLMSDLPSGKTKMKKTSGSGRGGGKRASKTGGKRGSKAGGKRASQAGKRASQAAGKRASKAPGKRASQAAGKRASQAAGKRASQAAGKRGSEAGGRRQSSKNTRRSTTMKGGKKESPKPAEIETDAQPVVEDELEEELIGEKEETEERPVTPAPFLQTAPPPQPGEQGWAYVEEHISDIYQIYLATTWESIEFVYLSNLLHLFYLMQSHDNKVIPYRNFIRNDMEQSLQLTDARKSIVSAFLKAFNRLPFEIRRQPEVKRRLHCRIYSLYNDLTSMADCKRNKALARREELIKQRWVTKHLFILANLFLNLMHIEVDRTTESLQLIHDYYFSMLQIPPSKERLKKLKIPKVFVPKRDESVMTIENSFHTDKTPLLPWEKIKEIPEVPLYVWQIIDDLDHLFANYSHKVTDPNPMYSIITRSIKLCTDEAVKLVDHYEDMILDPELGKDLRPKITKKLSAEEEKNRCKQEKEFKKKLEHRKQKAVVARNSSDSRDSKPRKIRKKKMPIYSEEGKKEAENDAINSKKQNFCIDASKLQMVDRLKWEWITAVHSEIDRLRYRLDLLANRAKGDLNDVLTIMKAVFDDFFHDVGWQYRREMKAIEDVFEMFKTAADLGLNIPRPVVLDYEWLYLGECPSDGLFPEVPPPPNTPIHAVPDDFRFTVEQLKNFIRKMEDLAPNGLFGKSFISILEDMVTFNQEMKYEFLPSGWSELTRCDITYLLKQAFGPDNVVNWRDFVLFCTGLRYPTFEEMVEMRSRFKNVDIFELESIQYKDYMDIPLWYEKDLDTDETVEWGKQIKNLLFTLFRVSRKEINYTDLLLSLCKGNEPESGIGKALSLLVGVGYVFWPDPPDWVHPRHVVDYVLIQVLHDVIIKGDYMTVTTLPPEELENTEESMFNEETGEELGEEENPVIMIRRPDEEEKEEGGNEEVGGEEEEEEEIEGKYQEMLWKTCVPYEDAPINSEDKPSLVN